MGGILGQVIPWLSGAPQAANTAGGYYQDAAGQLANEYGSPAAQTFVSEQNAALKPQFTAQRQDLIDRENALGILHSGAASNDLQGLYSGQSGALAQAAAPLYQQALGQYGGIISQMPGAQNTAYQDAIQQFMQAASMAAGGFGATPGGAPTGGGDPYGTGTDAGFDNASQLTYSEPGVYQPPASTYSTNPYSGAMSGDPGYYS